MGVSTIFDATFWHLGASIVSESCRSGRCVVAHSPQFSKDLVSSAKRICNLHLLRVVVAVTCALMLNSACTLSVFPEPFLSYPSRRQKSLPLFFFAEAQTWYNNDGTCFFGVNDKSCTLFGASRVACQGCLFTPYEFVFTPASFRQNAGDQTDIQLRGGKCDGGTNYIAFNFFSGSTLATVGQKGKTNIIVRDTRFTNNCVLAIRGILPASTTIQIENNTFTQSGPKSDLNKYVAWLTSTVTSGVVLSLHHVGESTRILIADNVGIMKLDDPLANSSAYHSLISMNILGASSLFLVDVKSNITVVNNVVSNSVSVTPTAMHVFFAFLTSVITRMQQDGVFIVERNRMMNVKASSVVAVCVHTNGASDGIEATGYRFSTSQNSVTNSTATDGDLFAAMWYAEFHSVWSLRGGSQFSMIGNTIDGGSSSTKGLHAACLELGGHADFILNQSTAFFTDNKVVDAFVPVANTSTSLSAVLFHVQGHAWVLLVTHSAIVISKNVVDRCTSHAGYDSVTQSSAVTIYFESHADLHLGVASVSNKNVSFLVENNIYRRSSLYVSSSNRWLQAVFIAFEAFNEFFANVPSATFRISQNRFEEIRLERVSSLSYGSEIAAVRFYLGDYTTTKLSDGFEIAITLSTVSDIDTSAAFLAADGATARAVVTSVSFDVDMGGDPTYNFTLPAKGLLLLSNNTVSNIYSNRSQVVVVRATFSNGFAAFPNSTFRIADNVARNCTVLRGIFAVLFMDIHPNEDAASSPVLRGLQLSITNNSIEKSELPISNAVGGPRAVVYCIFSGRMLFDDGSLFLIANNQLLDAPNLVGVSVSAVSITQHASSRMIISSSSNFSVSFNSIRNVHNSSNTSVVNYIHAGFLVASSWGTIEFVENKLEDCTSETARLLAAVSIYMFANPTRFSFGVIVNESSTMKIARNSVSNCVVTNHTGVGITLPADTPASLVVAVVAISWNMSASSYQAQKNITVSSDSQFLMTYNSMRNIDVKSQGSVFASAVHCISADIVVMNSSLFSASHNTVSNFSVDALYTPLPAVANPRPTVRFSLVYLGLVRELNTNGGLSVLRNVVENVNFGPSSCWVSHIAGSDTFAGGVATAQNGLLLTLQGHHMPVASPRTPEIVTTMLYDGMINVLSNTVSNVKGFNGTLFSFNPLALYASKVVILGNTVTNLETTATAMNGWWTTAPPPTVVAILIPSVFACYSGFEIQYNNFKMKSYVSSNVSASLRAAVCPPYFLSLGRFQGCEPGVGAQRGWIGTLLLDGNTLDFRVEQPNEVGEGSGAYLSFTQCGAIRAETIQKASFTIKSLTLAGNHSTMVAIDRSDASQLSFDTNTIKTVTGVSAAEVGPKAPSPRILVRITDLLNVSSPFGSVTITKNKATFNPRLSSPPTLQSPQLYLLNIPNTYEIGDGTQVNVCGNHNLFATTNASRTSSTDLIQFRKDGYPAGSAGSCEHSEAFLTHSRLITCVPYIPIRRTRTFSLALSVQRAKTVTLSISQTLSISATKSVTPSLTTTAAMPKTNDLAVSRDSTITITNRLTDTKAVKRRKRTATPSPRSRILSDSRSLTRTVSLASREVSVTASRTKPITPSGKISPTFGHTATVTLIPIPPPVLVQAVPAAVTAAVTSAAVALGGAAAAVDAQALAVIGLVDCGTNGIDTDAQSTRRNQPHGYRSISPFAIEDSCYGVLNGNALVLGLAALLSTIAVVMIKLVRKTPTWRAAMSVGRTPHFFILLATMLLNSFAVCGTTLLRSWRHEAGIDSAKALKDAQLGGLSWFFAVLLVASYPMLAFLFGSRRLQFIEFHWPSAPLKRRLAAFLLPTTQLDVDYASAAALGSIVGALRRLRAGWTLTAVFSFFATVPIIFAERLTCVPMFSVSAVLYFIFAIVVAVYRPRRALVNDVTHSIVLLLNGCLMAVSAGLLLSPGEAPLEMLSNWLGYGLTAMTVIRAVASGIIISSRLLISRGIVKGVRLRSGEQQKRFLLAGEDEGSACRKDCRDASRGEGLFSEKTTELNNNNNDADDAFDVGTELLSVPLAVAVDSDVTTPATVSSPHSSKKVLTELDDEDDFIDASEHVFGEKTSLLDGIESETTGERDQEEEEQEGTRQENVSRPTSALHQQKRVEKEKILFDAAIRSRYCATMHFTSVASIISSLFRAVVLNPTEEFERLDVYTDVHMLKDEEDAYGVTTQSRSIFVDCCRRKSAAAVVEYFYVGFVWPLEQEMPASQTSRTTANAVVDMLLGGDGDVGGGDFDRSHPDSDSREASDSVSLLSSLSSSSSLSLSSAESLLPPPPPPPPPPRHSSLPEDIRRILEVIPADDDTETESGTKKKKKRPRNAFFPNGGAQLTTGGSAAVEEEEEAMVLEGCVASKKAAASSSQLRSNINTRHRHTSSSPAAAAAVGLAGSAAVSVSLADVAPYTVEEKLEQPGGARSVYNTTSLFLKQVAEEQADREIREQMMRDCDL